MSIWSRLWRREEKTADPLAVWAEMFGATPSWAGPAVTWKTALEFTVSLACARVLAEGVAQVPLKLMRTRADGGADAATDEPLFDLVHRQVNDDQTSFDWREQAMFHLAFCGNHFAFKNIVRGTVRELIPFEPQAVSVRRTADGRIYTVTHADGRREVFPQEVMLHLRGPSWNGWMGLEGVKLARQSLGLGMALEQQAALAQKNGLQVSGVYSVENTLTAEQMVALQKAVVKMTTGENAGKPLILDRNAKWLKQAMSMVDAQHIESRRFQVEDNCRAWRVMPIMIGFADKTATYASAEQMFLAHVVHTLMPWYARLEQALDMQLLTRRQREAGHYLHFNANGLMRGAAKDRAEFYFKMFQMAALNPNEIRAFEELNPYQGGGIYRVPANTLSADAAADPPADPPEDQP